jgi:hypothetical protein
VATETDVYVVMVHDRHTDPEPHLFGTEDAALVFARETAADWLVERVGGVEGWLYYAGHPTESDAVWVMRKIVYQLGSKP